MKTVTKKYGWVLLSLILFSSCSSVEEKNRPVRNFPVKSFGPQGKPKIVLKEVDSPEQPKVVSVVRDHAKLRDKDKIKKAPKKMDLSLECVSPLREFKAGQPAKMTFRMRNYEFKAVFIKGWMIKESNNISLYYIPWVKKMKKPPKDKWLSVKPSIEKDPKTMTLELSPRNSVLLDIELPFVKEAKVSSPKHYVIQAQIKVDYVIKNQIKVDTFILNSQYMKITVKP